MSTGQGEPSGRGRPGPSRPGTSRPGTARAWARRPGTSRPSTSHRPGRNRHHLAAYPPTPRYGLLLLVLVVTYIISAFVSQAWVGAVQVVLFVWVTVLAVRTGNVGRHTARLVIALAIGGSAIAVTLALTHSADVGAGVANLWTALILLSAVVLIVRRVLVMPLVTVQSIFGAVSAYMIIGLMFAAVYSAMFRFSGGFFSHGEPDNVRTFQYFSFTTLTTLGYGDFTAAQSSGQALAVMEAMLGQVFLATLVARLVAAFRPQGWPGPARPGQRRPDRAGPGRRAARSSARRRALPARRTSSPARGRPARK